MEKGPLSRWQPHARVMPCKNAPIHNHIVFGPWTSLLLPWRKHLRHAKRGHEGAGPPPSRQHVLGRCHYNSQRDAAGCTFVEYTQ